MVLNAWHINLHQVLEQEDSELDFSLIAPVKREEVVRMYKVQQA